MALGAQIWCLRHGESSSLVAGESGAVPGAALTRTGRAQAVAAAATLAGLARRPTRVYTSTAVRAIQTADLLASELRLTRPLVPLNGLVEVGRGRLDGVDPVQGESATVIQQWVVHGGLDARVADESGHDVVARISSALRTIAADNKGGVVALVGHVASLTAGLSALCGIGPEVWGRPLPHAVPFRVDTDGTTWQCAGWPG
jgi:alpha-ribazole phosphatase/probable phosphoglycerate mutase